MKVEIFDWQDIVPKTQDKDNEFLGGDHILVGSPANLNEEDVVHSNSTSTNPSLIPPNHTRMDEVVGLHISVTWHTICQLSIGLCKKSVVRL